LRKTAALAGLLCLIAAAAQAAPATLHRDHPLTGSLWDVRAGKQVSEEIFFTQAAAARWVLLGEKHDNAEHHRLQARVVGALAQVGRRPAVVWEMAQPVQEAALRDARLPEVGDLGRALDWEARGWPAWPEYQPIAEQALRHGLAMYPGKPSQDLVRRVSRGEPLPDDLATRFDFTQPYPAAMEAALQEDLDVGHCGRLPPAALAPMVRVQRLWDAWMADALRRAGETSDGAVLIAGAGHVRKDRAVPWQLGLTGARAGDILTLALVEVRPGHDAAKAYDAFDPSLFDYVWFTPGVDREDPCAAFEGGSTQ
jgi:uncharacterized iron-regulated protein